MEKYEIIIKRISLFLMFFSIITNPFTIEYLLSPDKKFDFLWKYFVIFFFNILLFLIGFYTYFKSIDVIHKIKQLKNLIIKFLLLIFSIIVVIFFIEIISFAVLITSEDKELFNKKIRLFNNSFTENDKDIGNVLLKNNNVRVVKQFTNGNLIYNYSFSTDQYGRRIINQKYYSNNPHLVLFGGSVTFGEGLDDNETLQYFLNNDFTEYNLYNYAVAGYGSQHMLGILQKGNLPKEVESNKGIAIYLFIDNHIQRAIGSTNARWTFNSPYYYLDENDELKRKGFFNTGRPFITLLYNVFVKLKDKSVFLKLIELDFPPKISDDHIYLTYKIIEESKILYENQFNGTFYVILHPSYFDPEVKLKLIGLFEKNNINYFDYSTKYYRNYTIPNDGHPTSKLNKLFSEDLIKDFNVVKKF